MPYVTAIGVHNALVWGANHTASQFPERAKFVKAIRHFAWALAVLIPLGITPKALAANAFPGVGMVDYNEGANTLTLVIPYGGRNPYRVQWLNGQSRLVVDVDGMRLSSNRAMYIGMGVVEQIRAARSRATSTRLIFDLTQSADLRTMTDLGTRTLTLTIFPRGGAPVSRYAPSYGYVPGPRPTRRPAPPLRPYYPSYPITRGHITPAPVPQPSFAPITVPTPAPIAQATPVPEPTFIPTPEPQASTEATPSPEAPTEPAEFEVFGSRFTVGAEVPLSLSENYATGNSQTSVGLIPGGNIEWDQMFGSYFGFGIGTHAIGYTVQDKEAADAGVQVNHQRGDYEANIGPRLRLPLPAGLELFAQPGALVRVVTVANTTAVADANGTFGTPTASVGTDDYLSSGWTGYGGQLQAGIGWHAFGPLSLVAQGEYNALLAGSMSQPGVASIFPLMGFRAGAEARLDLSLFDMTVGYNLTNYSHADLSQNWMGPYVKVGIVY